MKVEIVEARFEHVAAICKRLRERERLGFVKLGDDPERLVFAEVRGSFLAFAGLVDDEPIALWGAQAAGVLDDEAYIWLICSQEAERHPMTFLRHSRRAIDSLSPFFKHLYGYVKEDFTCSVRWLEWLGFEIQEPVDGVRRFYR